MPEREISQVWKGVRSWQDDTLSLTFDVVEKPRSRHLCAIGGERFKGPYKGYSFKFKTERRSALMFRACSEHTPELEEIMARFQEELPELLSKSGDPIHAILTKLVDYDLHI